MSTKAHKSYQFFFSVMDSTQKSHFDWENTTFINQHFFCEISLAGTGCQINKVPQAYKKAHLKNKSDSLHSQPFEVQNMSAISKKYQNLSSLSFT